MSKDSSDRTLGSVQPKIGATFSIWLSYHGEWWKQYWRVVLPGMGSHVAGIVAGVIGASVGVYLRITQLSKFWPVLLSAAAGYILIILGTAVIRALPIASKMFNKQLRKVRKLEADCLEKVQTARSAEYLRRANDVIKLQEEIRRKDIEASELMKSLTQYYAIYYPPDSLSHRIAVLVHEIDLYIKSNPLPELPPVSAGTSKRAHFYLDEIHPAEKKIFHGYELHFKHRVIKVRDELAEKGLINQGLNIALDTFANPTKIKRIASGLLFLAWKERYDRIKENGDSDG